jgi:hypothetical protein
MNNVYIERSLANMHQEEMTREVSANRSAKRLRTHRRGSSSLRRFSGLFLLGLGRTLPERAAGS